MCLDGAALSGYRQTYADLPTCRSVTCVIETTPRTYFSCLTQIPTMIPHETREMLPQVRCGRFTLTEWLAH